MKKLLLWPFRIISILLLAPAFILAIPGVCLYILTEELLEW